MNISPLRYRLYLHAKQVRHAQRHAQRYVLNHVGRLEHRPVFIFGAPKSGTTAIAALLGLLTKQSVALDLGKQRDLFQYPAVLNGSLSMHEFVHQNRYEFTRSIIKEPSLTYVMSQILAYYLESRAVMIVRDPRDNIRSILDRLSLPGTISNSPPPTTLPHGWGRVFDNGWIHQSHSPRNHAVDALCVLWTAAFDASQSNRQRVTVVKYEDFLRDKVGFTEQLADSVGLSPRRTIEPYINRPFQPAGKNRTLPWGTFFGLSNLLRIEARCESGMHALGYADTVLSKSTPKDLHAERTTLFGN